MHMAQFPITPAVLPKWLNFDPKVRKITDRLDSVGNTTAAIGKGFCIGSAAFTALAMIVAFAQAAGLQSISLLQPGVLVALLFGAMLAVLLHRADHSFRWTRCQQDDR